MFSPYYAWKGRHDPLDHCAVNVALYGKRGARWAMTERRKASVERDEASLRIGRSALHWDGEALTIALDEVGAPLPRRVRGTVRVIPQAVYQRSYSLASDGSHVWRPIAPLARVEARFSAPDLSWNGSGYLDTNFGDGPLEPAFRRWTWSRSQTREGATIFYDAERRREAPLSLALNFAKGEVRDVEPPPKVALARTGWRVEREIRSEQDARTIETLEDTPFYARSRIEHQVDGQRLQSMHESLDVDRLAMPLVKAMLPFRMWRW